MTESLPHRVEAAIKVLEDLKSDPVTYRASYTPEDLKYILKMFERA